MQKKEKISVYKQGYVARHAGKNPNDNPYVIDSRDGKEWMVGWRDADKAMNRKGEPRQDP